MITAKPLNRKGLGSMPASDSLVKSGPSLDQFDTKSGPSLTQSFTLSEETLIKLSEPTILDSDTELLLITFLVQKLQPVSTTSIRQAMIEYCIAKNYCWTKSYGIWYPMKKLVDNGTLVRIQKNRVNYYLVKREDSGEK